MNEISETGMNDIDWGLHKKVYDFVTGEGLDTKVKQFLTKEESAKVREAVKLIATHNKTIIGISDREVGTLSKVEADSANEALKIMSEQVDVIQGIFRRGRNRYS